MTQNATSLFAPANMTSGGFLSNVDAVIVSAKFGVHADTPFDPLGKDEEDSCYLIVGFLPDDADDDTPRHEYYRMAVVSKINPSTDGGRAVFQDDVRLNKGTKAGIFFAALVNAGFPATDLPADNSCGFLVGLHVHLERVATEVKGDSKKPNARFKGKDDKGSFETTVITKLLEPKKGGKAAPKSAGTTGAASGASRPAAASAPAGDVNTAIQNAIVDYLMSNNGTAEKRLLPTELMKRITDKDTKTAAFKVIGKDDWLATGPWAFDAGAGTLSQNDDTLMNLAAREA